MVVLQRRMRLLQGCMGLLQCRMDFLERLVPGRRLLQVLRKAFTLACLCSEGKLRLLETQSCSSQGVLGLVQCTFCLVEAGCHALAPLFVHRVGTF